MADTTFTALKAEYKKLWDTMVVTKPTSVNALAKKYYANKARYLIVEKQTGVPWFVVAAWHNRESGGNFGTQLAQGDPLNRKSTNIPRGRGPFETWEDGAYDALVTLKGLNKITDWQDPARICYETERYNGFGYRNNHPNVLSPYLWSFTGHYVTGKYVADGKFDVKAVDQQCGAIPLIKRLMELDQEVAATPTPVVLPQKVTPPATKPVEKPLSAWERFKAWLVA